MKGRESGQRTCELGQNVIVQEFGQEEETCRSDVESSPSVPFLPFHSPSLPPHLIDFTYEGRRV